MVSAPVPQCSPKRRHERHAVPHPTDSPRSQHIPDIVEGCKHLCSILAPHKGNKKKKKGHTASTNSAGRWPQSDGSSPLLLDSIKIHGWGEIAFLFGLLSEKVTPISWRTLGPIFSCLAPEAAKMNSVDCPLCGKLFSPTNIENHVISCLSQQENAEREEQLRKGFNQDFKTFFTNITQSQQMKSMPSL